MAEAYQGKETFSKAISILLQDDHALVATYALPLLEESIQNGLPPEENLAALIYIAGIYADRPSVQSYEKCASLYRRISEVGERVVRDTLLGTYLGHIRDRLGSWGVEDAQSIGDPKIRIQNLRTVFELTGHPLPYLSIADAYARTGEHEKAEEHYQYILSNQAYFQYVEDLPLILHRAQEGLDKLKPTFGQAVPSGLAQGFDEEGGAIKPEAVALQAGGSGGWPLKKYAIVSTAVSIVIAAIITVGLLYHKGRLQFGESAPPLGSRESVTAPMSGKQSGPAKASRSSKPSGPVMRPGQAVSMPTHSVGTVYVMESINHSDPKLNYTVERKIEAVSSDRMTVSMRNLNSNYVRTIEYDHQWNAISVRGARGEGSDYAPPIKYYDFPLQPGKTWKYVSTERNIKSGNVREHTIMAEVGGWEKISVPAGTFQAIKIMIKNELRDLNTGKTTYGTDTSWYAPEVGRSVKSEMTSSDTPDARGDLQTVQLLRYTKP